MSKLVKCEENKQKIVTQCQSFKKLLKLSKCAGKKNRKRQTKKYTQTNVKSTQKVPKWVIYSSKNAQKRTKKGISYKKKYTKCAKKSHKKYAQKCA